MTSEISSSTDFRPDFFTAATLATTSSRVAHPLLGDLDDDVPRLHVLLGGGAVRLDIGDHHALDALADAELAAQLFGERRDGEAEQFLVIGLVFRLLGVGARLGFGRVLGFGLGLLGSSGSLPDRHGQMNDLAAPLHLDVDGLADGGRGDRPRQAAHGIDRLGRRI